MTYLKYIVKKLDDDDQLLIVNDGSGSDSDDRHGVSEFSQSSDEDYDENWETYTIFGN